LFFSVDYCIVCLSNLQLLNLQAFLGSTLKLLSCSITYFFLKTTNNDLYLYVTLHRKLRLSNMKLTPLDTEGELRCSGMVSSSCSTCDTRRRTVKRHEHHLIWESCWTPVYIKECK
jgi:hypothetical protein